MGFIGGNLEDIEASAARLVDSGGMAVTTGTDTHAAALQLFDAIDQAMSSLVSRFEMLAETLTSDIAQSHATLAGSDWQGQSRENALAIKENLQGQVTRVLGDATTSLASEKSTFVARAQALVDSVQTDFQRVMNEVEVEYAGLADASRRTRDNLALADQTIMMG